jgi:predicted nucleic acid-binding protein
MTAFIDTAILMYAAGSDHPLREPCAQVVRRIRDGHLDATTSVEVIQEIVHRYLRIGRPEAAGALASDTLDLLAPVLPVSHAVMRRVPDLVARYPGLQGRDLVHIATCIHEGITEIVSTDKGFDQVAEVKRIDPLAFTA